MNQRPSAAFIATSRIALTTGGISYNTKAAKQLIDKYFKS